ncbi:MAG: GMC family oxidoreductase, partial [Acidimicrobiales bacterium]|nr:GMC family oxidoreductase [Acidimicrobiales bacterium]
AEHRLYQTPFRPTNMTITRDARVIIVGSGPGGATFADVVTRAGWDCIVLEKGRNHLIDESPPYEPRYDFSNDELKFVYRYFLGPDPILEPRTFRRSPADGDRLFTGEVNNLPSTVGGGGVHADGKLPRFREVDFRLRSTYGPIEGASVEDWPITYDDLEPYYCEVEYAIGVAGDHRANPFASWRSMPYPMPPGPGMFGATISTEAAERLGLHPYPAPTGANSVPYDGRPACNNCGFCGFYGCPIHAKGDPIAMLSRALRTGRCQLRAQAYVTDILVDRTGRAVTGVRVLNTRDNSVSELHSDYVVLACGAFETPRLLLRSGIANSSGLVGRNLMFHLQTLTVGVFSFPLHGERGRDVTHLHDDHLDPTDDDLAAAREHGLPWIRGGVVEHGSAAGPVMEAKTYPHGPLHNRAMLDSATRARLWVFTMQGEDLPQPTNCVDLDPRVRDAWGVPSGRVTYRPHRHELVASRHFSTILERVMTEAGAEWAFTTTSPPTGEREDLIHANPLGIAPASRHIMGTCRMGADPATSVVGPESRFHDFENLLCADSSVFVTSAGYGPTLTLAALSARAAHLLTGTPLPPTKPMAP